MSHELDMTTGRPAMAYVGATPWHGLGQELQRGATIRQWTEAAGLDWQARLSPVYYGTNRDHLRPLGNQHVLYRSDTEAILSIISNRYKVVQPAEVLQFYADIARAGKFELETAGALFGGKKVWALASRGLNWTVGDADRLEAYLLLATSYDLTLSTTAMLTSVRVVCNNTLNLALDKRDRNRSIKIPHTKVFDADFVKKKLSLIDPAWERFKKGIDELVRHTVNDAEVRNYFERVLFPDLQPDEIDEKQSGKVDLLINIYKTAPGQELPTARNTAWGLVNAVTFSIDHPRPGQSQSRFDYSCFGQGQAIKARAWANACELATVR